MTKPVNLYLISRITDEVAYRRVEKHASGKEEPKRIQKHEIESLRLLVDALMKCGVGINDLDGFFLNYQIPQIGKEFDLLKFSETRCLNVELKSQRVPTADILAQLKKNNHYLAHLGKDVEFYTVITDTMTTYKLTDDGLQQTEFFEVAQAVFEYRENYLTNIDNMFRAADFLVSPLNTPNKFINGEYFLTQDQERIKRAILSDMQSPERNRFYSIVGKPGTGKTLLLYDIAKALSAKAKTAVVHCGITNKGQEEINRQSENLKVLSARSLNIHPTMTEGCKYILVDETHRMYPKQFDNLRERIVAQNQVCVFSSDPEQVLSKREKKYEIVKKILDIPNIEKYVLSEKIRTNDELSSFIISIRNLNKKSRVRREYNNISLVYANTVEEAKRIIEYFRARNYVFINYSKSNFANSPFSQYEEKEDYDTHHVIGQEFDNVLMLLDNSFYYDEKGMLCGVDHPNSDYLYAKLFYQGVTRVREKLALVVVGAPDLFEKITSVLQ